MYILLFINAFQIRDMLKCETVLTQMQSNKIFKCLLQKWAVLKELKTTLHLPYLSTVLLQNKDFTLSDFYGWLKIIDMKLKKLIDGPEKRCTSIAENLQRCLDKHKNKLLNDPLSLCAIFLDPRYKCDICKDPEKVRFVETTIRNLHERIKVAKVGELTESKGNEPKKSNTSGDVNSLYEELDAEYDAIGHSTEDKNDDIVVGIHKYESFISNARAKSSSSVHEFWENNKANFGPELYEVASIIYAVPPTQACVERCFSALKFLFNDYRYNLGEKLLENLMLIHLNPEIYYTIRNSEIKSNIKMHKK